MLNLRSIHYRFTTLLAVGSTSILLSLTACAQRASELKIVDLEGETIIRIDPDGSVFDDLDRKRAVINDREGTFTILRDHNTIAFKNDPSVKRENDRYIVKIGDGATFEVKADGSVLLDGKQWARVLGYAQNDVQRDRFMAAIAMIPFIPKDVVDVSLPWQVKNADHDKAMRRQLGISIPNKDEIYVGDEQIQGDFNTKLGEKIDEFLKRQSEANRIVNIYSSTDIEWGTIVRVMNVAREKGIDRIGLVVKGDKNSENRFLPQIPPQRDPNQDVSKLKPNPLTLVVSIGQDLQLKLNQDAMGSVNDPGALVAKLQLTFKQRKEQHVYKPGMETRTDLPEDQRVEKTVVIKAYRSCRYGDVIKIIDVVKGTGANPIILQLDDLW